MNKDGVPGIIPKQNARFQAVYNFFNNFIVHLCIEKNCQWKAENEAKWLVEDSKSETFSYKLAT